MATAAIDWDRVKHAVLEELERQPLRPMQLLDALGNRYPDRVIKEGVLRLLQEGSIKMTPDQQLELAERAA
jgi:hypothetical protein